MPSSNCSSKATPKQKEILLSLYHAIRQVDSESKLYPDTDTDVLLEKIPSLLKQWRKLCKNVDLAAFIYDGGFNIGERGNFLSDICLEKHKSHSVAVAKILLDEGIKSDELSGRYLVFAIREGDKEFLNRILDLRSEYGISIDAPVLAGRLRPLSVAINCLQIESVRTLIEKGASVDWAVTKGEDDPPIMMALRAPINNHKKDYGTALQLLEILLEAGASVKRHQRALCHSADSLFAGFLVDHGLDLNILHEPENVIPIVFKSSFYTRNDSHEIVTRRLDTLSDHTWRMIDFGTQLPEKIRKEYLAGASAYLLGAEYDLPVFQKENNSEQAESRFHYVPDYGKVPCFLANGMRAESLIGRCASFDLLDATMFETIRREENKRRAAVGDPELSASQLFGRLPPFLQRSEVMIPIVQDIKRQEAEAQTGLLTIAEAAKRNRGAKGPE